MIPAIYINSVFSSKSYRIGSILIDPGDEWEGFENVDAVLLTHAHFDHIYGLNRVVELNPGVKIFTNTAGQEALLNDRLNMSRYHETPFVLEYPENIIEDLGKKHKVYTINAMEEAIRIGNAKAFNVIVLGTAAKHMDFSKEDWLKVIEKTVPSKTVEINKKAFLLGYGD